MLSRLSRAAPAALARRLPAARLTRPSSSSSSNSTPPSSQAHRWALLGAAASGAGLLFAAQNLLRSDAPPTPASTPAPHLDAQHLPVAGAAATPADAIRARFGSPADYAAAVSELETLFKDSPDDISLDEDDRAHYGHSEWVYATLQPPTAVVWPRSTEDVQKILQIASRYRVPVIPYGRGTSLEGQFTAPYGGICVNLSKMDKIIAVHPDDGDVVVQAGVGYETLNDELKKRGVDMFLPLDPGPNATIGGMIGTGCSGTNSVRYGTARAEWFLNVTAVLPDGTILKTRQRARKSSTGPDMTKLFIGAEGTLGIVTEVTVRLAPRLPTRVGVVGFPSVRDAVDAVVEVLNKGVQVQCAELLDGLHVQAINHIGIIRNPLPAKDSIFFKFQGNPSQLADTAVVVQDIVRRHGGGDVQFAETEKDSEDLWAARKGALFAALSHSGYETPVMYGNDVCVPISRLPDLVAECQEEFRRLGVYAPIVGHVGDGNFHASFIMRGMHEVEATSKIMGDIVRRAQAMDGTCSGEHGIGTNKKKYLRNELGDGTLHLMRTIKNAVDPLGIMNPGKLYPDDIWVGDDGAPQWPPAPSQCC